MAQYPGFFASVFYGNSVLSAPTGAYDVSNVNFAMVYHEEEDEWKDRWTTWTLDADSMLLYQPANAPNSLIIGNDGHLYVLDDEYATDDGKAIPITLISCPLPEVDAQQGITASSRKRFQSVWWELATKPPTLGYRITVTLTDVNDPTNTVTRYVTQTTNRMHVDITLRCRQAYLSITTEVGKDFDPVVIGWSFQQESTLQQRKTTEVK